MIPIMNTAGPFSWRWLWITSIWFGLGLIDASQTVFSMRAQGMHHAWIRLFGMLLVSWLPWALATPAVVRLGRLYPPLRLWPVSTWIIHIAACVAIALTTALWNSWLEVLMNPWAESPGPKPFRELWPYKFYNGLLASLLLYSFILAISYVLESRERLANQRTETARLSEQLSRAQLDALRRQIEPHFLFNALNAISGLVRENKNDAAVSMIAGLSDFLRRVLEDSDRQQVPLGEEMEFLQDYLDIQKVRFADRLQVSVDVPTNLFLAQVPSLILQPMVENAVKHGIAKRAQGGTIRVSAVRFEDTLKLSVYNDGPGLPVDWETIPAGIGISNMRTRLHTLYGDGFDFSLRNHGPGGVEVSVSVPFRSGPFREG
jgi:two-component system LytT family sensor kinase